MHALDLLMASKSEGLNYLTFEMLPMQKFVFNYFLEHKLSNAISNVVFQITNENPLLALYIK